MESYRVSTARMRIAVLERAQLLERLGELERRLRQRRERQQERRGGSRRDRCA